MQLKPSQKIAKGKIRGEDKDRDKDRDRDRGTMSLLSALQNAGLITNCSEQSCYLDVSQCTLDCVHGKFI